MEKEKAQETTDNESEGRSEDQKLFQDPLIVVLGSTTYEVPIKTIAEDREWRKKCGSLSAKLAGMITKYAPSNKKESKELEELSGSLTEKLIADIMPIIFGEGLDDVIDMLWLYCDPVIKKEEVENTVSSEDVIDAAFKLFEEIGFPFIVKMVRRMMRMGQSSGLLKT